MSAASALEPAVTSISGACHKASHVLLNDPSQTGPSGITLKAWLSLMLSDDAKWTSDKPW